MKPLPKKFFRRQVLRVAPDLLGKYIARRMSDGTVRRWKITEVEAYDGEKDLACHASKGKTARNRIMYEPGGVWYVYLVYGFHYMLNIVTGEKDYPAAVLIRGIEGAVGPGRTAKALGVNLDFNGRTAEKKFGLWIEEAGAVDGTAAKSKGAAGVKIKSNKKKQKIRRAPRIGVEYAGAWAKKPYRFILED